MLIWYLQSNSTLEGVSYETGDTPNTFDSIRSCLMSTRPYLVVPMNLRWCSHGVRVSLYEEKNVAGPFHIMKCARWRPKCTITIPTTNGYGGQAPLNLSPIWARVSFGLGVGISRRAESWMTTLRSRMTAHCPSFHAAMTRSLECLSSACWVLVRSAWRKILCMIGS